MELFKYLHPDRIDVLQNGTLRFSQPSALNDPFELRPYFNQTVADHFYDSKKVMAPGGDVFRKAVAKLYTSEPGHFRQKTSLPEFEALMLRYVNSPGGRKFLEENLRLARQLSRDMAPSLCQQMWDELAVNIGILSLSQDGNHPLMWAHYTAAHMGFCMGFDSANEFFDRRRSPNDELFYLREVEYRTRDTVATLVDIDGTRILACKTPEWVYEKEVRMLALLDDADVKIGEGPNAICLFRFPAGAVTSITYGLRSSPMLRNALRELRNTKYPDAELRQIIACPAGTQIVRAEDA